ncbi:hypothetical protein BCR42DRAFT_430571, partial [Absidia repens]
MGGCYLCGSKPGKTKSNHSPNEQYLRSRHIYISSTRSSCDLPERRLIKNDDTIRAPANTIWIFITFFTDMRPNSTPWM